MSKSPRRAAATVFALAVTGATLPAVGAASAVESAPQAEKQVYIVQTTGHDRAQAAADPGKRAEAVRSAYGVSPRKTFTTALSGFSASMTSQQAAALERRPDVVKVEVSRTITRAPDAAPGKKVRNAGVTWGLDRIDQRGLPLNSTYSATHDGSGVTSYVLDTGVNTADPDFEGRAVQGVNTSGDGTTRDCHGHGTHVAGTVGSQTYGVAKGTSVVGVKVFTCAAQTNAEMLIAGLDWVATNADGPAVANASWYDDSAQLTLVNEAAEGLVRSGVFLTVAAGNSSGYFCGNAPQGSPSALVVASSGSADERSYFSSTGECVDVYAPGSSITSLDNDGSGTVTMSGTSMAAPHAAGVAALYLQQNPDATPAQVKAWIEDSATPDVVSGGSTGGTVNRLLFTNGL